MEPYLDKFQQEKRARMRYLFEDIKERNEVSTEEFLDSIAVAHGIRRATGEEYLRDWMDAGYITIANNIIKLVKLPRSSSVPISAQENQEQTSNTNKEGEQ
jgi:hypothetical protein